METYGLGPNGGLMYCMEYIEKNLDWLFEKLEALGKSKYFLFDFPGQVGRISSVGQQFPVTCVESHCIILPISALFVTSPDNLVCSPSWQVELYTHGDAARNILQALQKWGCRLSAVHLVDAHHCRYDSTPQLRRRSF